MDLPVAGREPLDDLRMAKRFQSLLHQAGLPRFRLYDLRHTYATHLLEPRAPITSVAAQLGHAKPTTTLAFYAHWLLKGDKQHIDRLIAAREPLSGTKTIAANSVDQTGTIGESLVDARLAEHSPVAQLVERLTVNQEVAGSSPARGANYFEDF